MRVLHLFAGAGGGLLADLLLGHRIVGAVEIEDFPQRVLAQRQKDGLLPEFPIFGDIRAFNAEYAEQYRGVADCVAGGFPCQPFSVAGKRASHADERNLWPETLRTIRLVRPRRVFLENVPGLLSARGPDGGRYFASILGDLAEAGYVGRYGVLGADDAGAPHRRKRLWVVADAPDIGG